MFFYDGYICPVCEKAFDEKDDIVACPTCGAPHHRACWHSEGQCHFAAQHGTPEQWSRQTAQKVTPSEEAADTEERICPQCGHHNPAFAEFCAHCGKPLEAEDWSAFNEETEAVSPPQGNPYVGYREYSPYHIPTEDPASGIPPHEMLEDVSARDVAAAVGNNTAYYLPRFRRFNESGALCSWNWGAFLFTSYWLFHRKNYLAGSLLLLAETVTSVLTAFIYYQLFPSLSNGGMPSFQEFQALLMNATDLAALRPILALYLLSFVVTLIHVFLGLFGTRLYYRTCLTRARKFREQKPDGYPAELTAIGGTSMLLSIIAYFAQQFISYILLSLLSLLL